MNRISMEHKMNRTGDKLVTWTATGEPNWSYIPSAGKSSKTNEQFVSDLFLTGIILIGCGSEKTGDGYEYQTGVHKIVIRQSGDTGAFDVNVSIGGADKGGPAKLYNDKGEYIGDSYSAQIKTATMSCHTSGNAFFMTCAGSVSSISEAGKRLHITVIAYIDDKEVNRLEKDYITDGSTLVQGFSVSTKEI